MYALKKPVNIAKTYVFFMLLANISGCTIDHIDEIQVEKEVLQSFESLVSASKSLDSDQYFQHFDAEHFIGLNNDGSTWHSIDDLRALIEPGFSAIDKIESLRFTHVKLSVIDKNTVILVNEFEQELVLKDGSNVTVAGGGTQVWSKSGGDWKLVSISASNKPVNH